MQSARIMRQHRARAVLPYLVVTSGAEVPGCGGGAYHLQERSDAGAASGSTRGSPYTGRVRSGGNNVRISLDVVARPSPAASAQTSPTVLLRDSSYVHMREFEPFEGLFRRYISRGQVAHAPQRLLHHPDAPAPMVLLDRLLQHRVPAAEFVVQALLASVHAARTGRSTSSSSSSSFALQRVLTRLRSDAACRVLYYTPNIRVLLIEAAVQEALFDDATSLVQQTPAEWLTPHTWSVLVQAAGHSKLPHSQLLWRLLSERDTAAEQTSASSSSMASMQRVLTRAGESALLRRVPLCSPQKPVAGSAASAFPTMPPQAPPQPDLPSSSPSPPSPSAALSSQLPLEASGIPNALYDTRVCGTVRMPTYGAIGTPLWLRSSADTAAASQEESAAAAAAPAASPTEAASTSSAIVPSAFSTDGARWCAMSAVDMGYAAEHFSSDTAAAAGDFRASASAGVLHGFSSFQSLFAEVEAEVRASSSDAAASGASPRRARRAMWEATTLRMIHPRHGITYGLDAALTARVLLRCGVGFSAQASPLLALHVLRRYLRSCHVLRDELVRTQTLIEAQLDVEEAKLSDAEPSSAGAAASSASGEQRAASSAFSAVTAVQPARSAAALQTLYPRLSRAVAPHPSPFLVFFKVMREARDVLSNAVEEEVAAGMAAGAGGVGGGAGASAEARRRHAGLRANSSLPMVHWELVWQTFQQLNRENPEWHTLVPLQEAGDLCHDVISVLCHGADPWLTLNIARRVSARHIVDGVEMSLWLLHRLDSSHHTEEAREVARKLFRWLLVDVGMHLQPSLHHHLIPAARALIRLNLQDELRVLYNAVLDNVYLFNPDHRDAFIRVVRDLICPACASILPESDVYVDRACPNCMAIVPAKDADTVPSFRLSAEHVERVRARRKQQRQRTRERLSASVHRLQTEEREGGAARGGRFGQPLQLRGPQDAADVLRRHLRKGDGNTDGESDEAAVARLLLAGDATLVPGVRVASGLSLFPVGDDGGDGAALLDVRAAMEESSRRLELQRAARRYALAQRGESESDSNTYSSSGGTTRSATAHTPAAMPTTLPVSAQALDAATLKYLSTAANAGAAATTAASDGVWVCVWCQEKNSEWSSRVRCSACGAETGPTAPWRHFAYADPATGDVMAELRGRMSNCEDRPVDAIVAGYLLMVYRRTFQLRATPADHDRLQRLVAMLCRLQERVLAAYVFTRLVPVAQRRLGALLDLLAQTYGQESAVRYRELTQEDVTQPAREGVFFDAVFGPQTCRVCFGTHDWQRCPIVTRDFAGAGGDAQRQPAQQRNPISLSPEEKQQAVLERLSQRIHQAAESVTTSANAPSGRPNAQLVVDAYTTFVSSPFREVFAELHADDTNRLSQLLSAVHQFRRAAFVLCHVPPAQRANASYLRLVHFFNVTAEEALALLQRPPSAGAAERPVPNFVQVTKTCCMCLDQRHASHECPRLEEWLKGVQRLAAVASASRATSTSSALADAAGEARLRQRLRAQVDGWTTAGPERLHAFYRYLAAHLDLLRPSANASLSASASGESNVRRVDFSDPFVYAVNRTVAKLAAQERRSEAYRLYAHAPVECVSAATTTAVLRMNGFAEDSIRALLKTEDTAADPEALLARGSSMSAVSAAGHHAAALPARLAAVPVQRCCLLCFASDHAYVDCPELATAATEVDRLLLVIKEVGGISCVHDGIGAAAAYVYSEYNRGRFSSEMMRSNPALVAALLTLARRCFATRQLSHGVRVLRRIPVEMTPPATAYADLWRAAGLAEAEVEEKQAQLLALFDAEGLVPSVDSPPPRPTFSNHFLSQLGRTLHDGLCRHCFEHGHTISTCPLFHSEVSFGRDYVAAYRMSMMSEQLDRAWQEAYLLKLVDFFATHHLFMPYHIAGVANALNAITAMWSFRGEPGIALRHLLLIPPAYRRRQAFKHVLHSLRVPATDITRLLGDFYFAPDGAAGSSSNNPQQQQEMAMAQHLLIPKPAIRDAARRQIFEQVPAAMAALEESAERMAQIREAHEKRFTTTHGAGSVARQQQQQQVHDGTAVAAASFRSAVLTRVMQSGDMSQLREDFDPILAELEDAVGMRLGSRHTLFTGAVDILGAATAAPVSNSSGGSSAARSSVRPAAAASTPATPAARAGSRSTSPTAASSSSSRDAAPEAEVVIEVETQPVQPPPSSPPSPSSATSAKGHAAPARPAQRQQQGAQRRRDTQPQQRREAGGNAGAAGRAPVKTSPASSNPSSGRSVGRAGSEDEEVLSDFPTSTTTTTRQFTSPQQNPSQQQQQHRRAGSGEGRSYDGNRRRQGGERGSNYSGSASSSNHSRRDNRVNYGRSQRSNAPTGSSNQSSGRDGGGGARKR